MRNLLRVVLAILLSGVTAAPGAAAVVDPAALAPRPQAHFADSGSKAGVRLHDTGDSSHLYPMDIRLVDSTGTPVFPGGVMVASATIVDKAALNAPPLSFFADSGQKSAVRLHDTGDGSGLYPMDVRLVDSGGNPVAVGTVASVTGGQNIVVTGTPANPIVSTTAAPTFAGKVTAASFTGTNLAGGGTQCLQTDNAGNITATGTACGTGGGGGTLTSVVAGNNITVANGTGPAATVAVVTNPSFTGPVTSSAQPGFVAPGGFYQAGTAGSSNFSTGLQLGSSQGTYTYLSNCAGTAAAPASSACLLPQGNSAGVFGSALFYSSNATTYMTMDGSGDMAVSGYLQSGTLTNGNCLQGGALGRITSTAAACGTVSNVTGVGNISVATGTTTPVVSETASPTYTAVTTGNLTDSALTSGRCVQAGTAGILTNSASPCLATVTGGPGVNIVGSGTAAVTINQTISVNGAAPVVAHAPEIFSGGTAIATGASRTYTFNTAFANTGYSCTSLQSAAGINPLVGGTTGMYVSSKLTTSVTITNSTGATQTPDVTCNGI